MLIIINKPHKMINIIYSFKNSIKYNKSIVPIISTWEDSIGKNNKNSPKNVAIIPN
jgi:hypothetical protein